MNVLLCPMSQGGYLYPALAIGRELASAGDRPTVLGLASAAQHVAAAGLEFIEAEPHDDAYGFSVTRWFRDTTAQFTNVLRVANDLRPDALVTSALSLGALIAGEVLDLPVFVIGFTTHILNYRGPVVESAYQQSERIWRSESMLDHYQAARERLGLAVRREPVAEAPLYAAGLLLRGTAALQCPGAELPSLVHLVGPCSWEPPAPPDELGQVAALLRRNGKRVVYVHLGRTFGDSGLWPRLNRIFTGGQFQALVERGRSGFPEPAAGADIIVVRKPWMDPLIALSELVLTSGTSSPVLGALLAERPLVMAPHGSEQLVLTDACVRAGVAQRCPGRIEGGRLADLVLRTTADNPEIASRVTTVSAELRAMPGAQRAAKLIRSVSAGRTVVSGVS